MKFLLAAIGTVILGAGVATAQDANSQDPSQILENAARTMLKELDAHRADYRNDPSKIDALVEKDLLPHFDTEYAARLVLGAHWRDASAEQRKRAPKTRRAAYSVSKCGSRSFSTSASILDGS